MKEKANLSKIQTDLNSGSKLVSSASQTNERTEDDVGDEMDISMQCDGCKKLIGGINKLELLECLHFYCPTCSTQQVKEKHKSCSISSIPSSAFVREVSPQQDAEHDGELSEDNGEGKKGREPLHLKSGSARKRPKKNPDQQLWYFLYLSKPVVVSIPIDATFGDLLTRLYITLGIDKTTHEINIKIQKSTSEEGGEQESSAAPGEPAPLEAISSKSKLSALRLPRQKMMLLDVENRKSKEKDEKKEKDAKKNSKEKEKDKKATHEELPSFSQSRADEPKSS